MAFNPDSAGVYNGNYFGFEFSASDSSLSLLSVGYDATVSYGSGSSYGPVAIVEASTQVEILESEYPDVWQRGIYTVPFDSGVMERNLVARAAACRVIGHIEAGGDESDAAVSADVGLVNESSQWLNQRVYDSSMAELRAGRVVGLVGGDHSTPLGLIRALGECGERFGILHIDAHMDLRDGYEGFVYSHASIMRRAVESVGVESLTQVAVRDFSEPEVEFAKSHGRITQFTDTQISRALAQGASWDSLCTQIVDSLPSNVYISFDIDGLEAAYCPNTGTPVPGGITYNQALYLLWKVHQSGRRVVGFDLCEVAPRMLENSSAEPGFELDPDSQWDAVVGARLLYKLCNLTLSSQAK